MLSLDQRFNNYLELLSSGKTRQAIDQYYAEEVCVLENQHLVRSGRAACSEHEGALLATLAAPPTITVRRSALNPEASVAFVEYTVRFCARGGRPMRLDQVAVQTWAEGSITEERFYYLGLVDEGDEEDSLNTNAPDSAVD